MTNLHLSESFTKTERHENEVSGLVLYAIFKPTHEAQIPRTAIEIEANMKKILEVLNKGFFIYALIHLFKLLSLRVVILVSGSKPSLALTTCHRSAGLGRAGVMVAKCTRTVARKYWRRGPERLLTGVIADLMRKAIA